VLRSVGEVSAPRGLEQEAWRAGSAGGLGGGRRIADEPRARERQVESGRGLEQEAGERLAAIAAVFGAVRAEEEAGELDALGTQRPAKRRGHPRHLLGR